MKIEIAEINEYKEIASIVEEVQNLHADLFPNVYKRFDYYEIEKVMVQMLSKEQCRLFIAQINEMTVGYIIIMIKEIPENAFHYSTRILHIDQLAVAEEYKKKGVGAVLIDKVEKVAQELNIFQLELEHLENNLIAKRFFFGKGFLPYRSKLMKKLN